MVILETYGLCAVGWDTPTVVGTQHQLAILYILSDAITVQLAGGPHIPLRFGRTDACEQEEQVPEGRLPGVS